MSHSNERSTPDGGVGDPSRIAQLIPNAVPQGDCFDPPSAPTNRDGDLSGIGRQIANATVGRIITRVVADHLDERRLGAGPDRGRRDLLPPRAALPDQRRRPPHRQDPCGARRDAPAGRCRKFFELLGERKDSIRAVSLDTPEPYAGAIRRPLPNAQITFDPFHVIALAGVAIDQVHPQHSHTMAGHLKAGQVWIKHARWALLKASEKLDPRQQLALAPDPTHQPAAIPRLPAQRTTPRPPPTHQPPPTRPPTSTPGSPGHRAPNSKPSPHP